MSIRKRFACEKCGSENVTHDALARWDVKAQDWVVSSLLDNNDCNDCGEDGCVVEVDYKPEG